MKSIIAKLQELYKPRNTTSDNPANHRGSRLRMLIYGARSYGHDAWAAVCILLALAIGYNLGRANTLEKLPISFGQNASIFEAVNSKKGSENPVFRAGDTPKNIPPPVPRDPRVVTAKSSKKYHYSWCASGKKIKPENQVWFENEEAAQTAGYTLAGNCQ